MGQRNDLALETIYLNGVEMEESVNRGPPLARRIVSRNCAVGRSLAHMMDAAFFTQFSLEHALKHAVYDIIEPPRSMINHHDAPTARPQYSVHLV